MEIHTCFSILCAKPEEIYTPKTLAFLSETNAHAGTRRNLAVFARSHGLSVFTCQKKVTLQGNTVIESVEDRDTRLRMQYRDIAKWLSTGFLRGKNNREYLAFSGMCWWASCDTEFLSTCIHLGWRILSLSTQEGYSVEKILKSEPDTTLHRGLLRWKNRFYPGLIAPTGEQWQAIIPEEARQTLREAYSSENHPLQVLLPNLQPNQFVLPANSPKDTEADGIQPPFHASTWQRWKVIFLVGAALAAGIIGITIPSLFSEKETGLRPLPPPYVTLDPIPHPQERRQEAFHDLLPSIPNKPAVGRD